MCAIFYNEKNTPPSLEAPDLYHDTGDFTRIDQEIYCLQERYLA